MEILGISPHLTDYYYLVRRRAWLVLSSLALTVLFAAVFTFSMKPVYRATASLIIDKETSRSPLTGEQLEAESFIGQQLTFRTHFNLIKSRPVLEKVLQQLGPATQPERPDGVAGRFFSTVWSNLNSGVSWVFSPLRGPAAPQNEETLLLKRIGQLTNKISIEGIRDTRLLLVHVEDNDPKTAQTIADAVAENYILYDSETRLDSARKIFDRSLRSLWAKRTKTSINTASY